MKEFKNYLICIVTSLFAFAFFLGIPSSAYSSEIKSAEQSVYDFFEAVQKKDYDTLNKVTMNKWVSEDVRRNTVELQHEDALIAEKPPTILSSEKRGEDMVIVKVSYVLDGEERIMTYPVVLVNNEWIVNLGDAVGPSVGGVRWANIVPVTDYSTTNAPATTYEYSNTLNILLKYYFPFVIANTVYKYGIL